MVLTHPCQELETENYDKTVGHDETMRHDATMPYQVSLRSNLLRSFIRYFIFQILYLTRCDRIPRQILRLGTA